MFPFQFNYEIIYGAYKIGAVTTMMGVNKKQLQCKNYPITYTLIRKQVKNINMRITMDGEVVVSANPFVALDKIDDFVSKKATWIEKHQKMIVEKNKHCLIDSKHILLFGNSLIIKYNKGKENHVTYDDKYLYVQYSENTKPETIISHFIDQLCKDVFMDVTMLTCDSLKDYDVPFPTIKIRDMKSRWGSCTPSRNSITLNRKLIHYPLEFIEYVILHECVHFIQPNHSKAFYSIIESFMPDYKKRIALGS